VGLDVREGEITAHFFSCPFCDGYADLETHVCKTCGARVEAILWSHDSPELAMVSTPDGGPRVRAVGLEDKLSGLRFGGHSLSDLRHVLADRRTRRGLGVCRAVRTCSGSLVGDEAVQVRDAWTDVAL
jgi:hypothetical protein